MQANLDYGKSLARAFGGALLFAFPLFMTMEMWSLGFSMDRWRLLILLVLSLPMLLGLSFYSGFEPTFRLKDEVLDALAAFGVGFLLCLGILALFGVLGEGMALGEVIGKLGLCTVPASIGALLAGKQLGAKDEDSDRQKARAGYLGELFLMSVGALFLAFNVAPTEEVLLIAYQMNMVQALLLVALSIGLLHGFVFSLGFPGEQRRREAGSFLRAFLSHTAPGYGVALLISVYALWTFGRLDGVSLHEAAAMVVVMAFPSALGAATARLVV